MSGSAGTTSVMWFRRDLRTRDHPALAKAAESGEVLPLFVLDPALEARAGRRLDRLLASLASLRHDLDGALVVRRGDPARVLPQVVEEAGAASVHVSAETTPYGRRRDAAVEKALEEVPLVRTGSPYAVGPGRVTKKDGEPYRVFTPFARAWREHGWADPAPAVDARWVRRVDSDADLPRRSDDAGEQAALTAWRRFRDGDLDGYADGRDRPDLDATSRLSPHLKYGEIHPRTILHDLQGNRGKHARTYADELAWREFYADVLYHEPRSAWHDLNPIGLGYSSDDDAVDAWREGRTGYPFVDAGMRQLKELGWMHNRLRMVTASFLCKDLHVWWPVGARHFLDLLLDGDVASNNHGWQWVAGTGTDAAPYFRVFNPVAQGLKFDPRGDYVRRWVPELAHLEGKAAHEPWKHDDGYAHGYPERIVDHGDERAEALDRYNRARGRS